LRTELSNEDWLEFEAMQACVVHLKNLPAPTAWRILKYLRSRFKAQAISDMSETPEPKAAAEDGKT
jgi:hypothetical protein